MHPLMRDRKGPVKSVNYQAPDGELAFSNDETSPEQQQQQQQQKEDRYDVVMPSQIISYQCFAVTNSNSENEICPK